ncbi:MAG: CBS domain-containing protein [Peptococcia bacterium]
MKNLSSSNADRFITIYNELDEYMRKYLQEDERVPHTELIKKMVQKSSVFNAHKHELKSFASLRNAIVHNPDKKNADPIAEPHSAVITRYESIKNQVLDPPRALDTIAVKASNIFIATLNSNALNVMKEMSKNTYTHVPVLDKGVLIGVFSESTLFSYIIKNGVLFIEDDVLIKEFEEFIPIDKHESECFEFVSKKALVIDIENIFQIGLKDQKRISVVFITENGKPKEKILGMITAWDLAGYNPEGVFNK